jgi:hypothetical protein
MNREKKGQGDEVVSVPEWDIEVNAKEHACILQDLGRGLHQLLNSLLVGGSGRSMEVSPANNDNVLFSCVGW